MLISPEVGNALSKRNDGISRKSKILLSGLVFAYKPFVLIQIAIGTLTWAWCIGIRAQCRPNPNALEQVLHTETILPDVTNCLLDHHSGGWTCLSIAY
jgi:hypothetical protein